jgi:hypothetical protein
VLWIYKQSRVFDDSLIAEYCFYPLATCSLNSRVKDVFNTPRSGKRLYVTS